MKSWQNFSCSHLLRWLMCGSKITRSVVVGLYTGCAAISLLHTSVPGPWDFLLVTGQQGLCAITLRQGPAFLITLASCSNFQWKHVSVIPRLSVCVFFKWLYQVTQRVPWSFQLDYIICHRFSDSFLVNKSLTVFLENCSFITGWPTLQLPGTRTRVLGCPF